MNSIMLCEGSTDYFLLQYYMRKACGWEDDRERQQGIFKVNRQKSRKLFKKDGTLTIAAVGGCSRLKEGLKQVVSRNLLAAPGGHDFFDSVVLITDRDETETEQNFIEDLTQVFRENLVWISQEIGNNAWVECSLVNNVGQKRAFRFLLLVIPFEEEGAMETFLLDAIAKEDLYDGEIIRKCKVFVDQADPEKRYLSGRRLITKAKFDTYFSIRTSAEQFMERQNILKEICWERYTEIQKDFRLLTELS